MLIYFEVQGFKNFEEPISLDFTAGDYKFNEKCIRNGVVHNAIIYGKNSVGKTNFGLALFDIVAHLTSNNVTPGLYDNYLACSNCRGEASFKYVFQFGKDKVVYEYRKEELRILTYEKVVLNDKIFIEKDYLNPQNDDFSGAKELSPTLNYSFVGEGSVLRYIFNNTALESNHPLFKTMKYVSHMLWIRSLDENRYIGYKNSRHDYFSFILDNKSLLQEFESLLHQAGVEIDLHVEESPEGKPQLYAAPKNDPLGRFPFYQTASSGTKALYSYFYWKKTSPELSLLFIDEFDAYYHFELAEVLQKQLQDMDCQVITTSHNTNLLSNRLMRPDCYFILTPKKLVFFSKATKRELREGHNLEKLFMSGEFNE